MRVTFWGTRGTFPVSGVKFSRYGGDTMCVEVECGDARIILDAGSGLRALGAKLNVQEGPARVHIVLSHLHLDHVMGLSQFAPFWRPDASVFLHAPFMASCAPMEEAALLVLRPPLFPICAGDLPAAIVLRRFHANDAFLLERDVRLHTIALHHQGVCAGLIVEWRGRKLCYVTDHEHGDHVADERLERAVARADMLIYDATFTDAEMPARRGWGHSSWEEGVRLKERSGVRLLALAHHDPDRTDEALDTFSVAAAAKASNVFFARSRMRVSL